MNKVTIDQIADELLISLNFAFKPAILPDCRICTMMENSECTLGHGYCVNGNAFEEWSLKPLWRTIK